MQNYLFSFCVILVFSCANDQQEKVDSSAEQNDKYVGIGNIYDVEKTKIVLNLLDPKCGSYNYLRVDFENAKEIAYIFISHGNCKDAAFSVVVDKVAKRILHINPKNMA